VRRAGQMDGGGCVAEPVVGTARAGKTGTARRAQRTRRSVAAPVRRLLPRTGQLGTLARPAHAPPHALDPPAPPRGIGIAATALIILGSIAFGIVRGDHVEDTVVALRETRDTIATGLGFGVTGVALTGNKHLSREEILAIAGVSSHTTLLFLD